MNTKKIKYIVEPKDMSYVAQDEIETIASGIYRRMPFVVKNMRGRHPCVYVNVRGTKLDGVEYDDIHLCVHGGVSFSETELEGENDGWWIGWDYAHAGDYSGIIDDSVRSAFLFSMFDDAPSSSDGRKWETDELVTSAVNAIDEILEGEDTDE